MKKELKSENGGFTQLGELNFTDTFYLAQGNDGKKKYVVIPFRARDGHRMVAPLLLSDEDPVSLWELPIATPVVRLT